MTNNYIRRLLKDNYLSLVDFKAKSPQELIDMAKIICQWQLQGKVHQYKCKNHYPVYSINPKHPGRNFAWKPLPVGASALARGT